MFLSLDLYTFFGTDEDIGCSGMHDVSAGLMYIIDCHEFNDYII